MPGPGALDDTFEPGQAGSPSQGASSGVGRCHETSRISGSSFSFSDRNLSSRDPGDHVDDLSDRIALAVSQVEAQAARFDIVEGAKGQHMGIGQVVHMNVVPDTGSIGRGIVASEDGDGVSSSQRRVEDQGDQVGFRAVVFADFTFGIGSGSVEVS